MSSLRELDNKRKRRRSELVSWLRRKQSGYQEAQKREERERRQRERAQKQGEKQQKAQEQAKKKEERARQRAEKQEKQKQKKKRQRKEDCNDNVCQGCGGHYDEDEEESKEGWIGCDERGCWRLYHYWCAGLVNMPALDQQRICPAFQED